MNHLRAKILLNINLLYFFFMLSAKDETSILLSFDRYRSYLLPELQEHLGSLCRAAASLSLVPTP